MKIVGYGPWPGGHYELLRIAFNEIRKGWKHAVPLLPIIGARGTGLGRLYFPCGDRDGEIRIDAEPYERQE